MPKVTMALSDTDRDNAARIEAATQSRSKAHAVSIALSLTRYLLDQRDAGKSVFVGIPGEIERVHMVDVLPGAPGAEDVLNAFSVEPNPDKAALTVYLKKYPQHALDLIDLFIDLHRTIPEDTGEPLSPEEEAIIDKAWKEHAAARPDRSWDTPEAVALMKPQA